jgi:hypothetical protein
MSYTLTTLRDSIKDYTENSETTFIPHIRDFIRSAEGRLFKTIDFVFFRKNATSATTSSDAYLSVPTDFLSSHSLSVTSSSNKIFLLEKDVNFIHEYNPNSATTGVPKYYARFDVDNFIMAPTPNSNYTTELHYYYRPTSLADSTITINVNLSNSLAVGETITGASSAATAEITAKDDSSNILTVYVPASSFTVGETITGGTTEASTTISSIGSDTTKTWLSKNAINAMLYGSLLEAYIYMKGEADMVKLYSDRFIEEISRLKDLGEARETSDSYRVGLARRPKT